MKEEIIKLCNFVFEYKECKNCGASEYEDGICIYCHKEYKEINDLVSKILELIEKVEIDSEILLSLNSIKFVNCDKIKNILKQNNFDIFFKDLFNEITEKIKSNQIKPEDMKYIYYFVNNKYYTKENNEYVAALIMSNLMINKLDLSIEEKLEFVKYFTETYIKTFYPITKKTKCEFVEGDNDYIGFSLYNYIGLDKKEVIEYLESSNYLKLLILIFHECTHSNQKLQMTSKEGKKCMTYMNLLNVKEKIIRQKNKDYYKENYIKYSHEVEARYASYELTLLYLDSKKIKLDEKSLRCLNLQMENEMELILDETRTIDGQITTVDEIFESIEIDLNTFEKYPILSLEYKYENGKIVRKTKEELESDYNLITPSTEIDWLYKKLLEKTNNKKL